MSKILKAFAALFVSAMLFACGSLQSDYEMELNYNYLLLKAYFYWSEERLKNFSEYEGMEVNAMYNSLGDGYTRYYKPEVADNTISNIENSQRYYSFGFERKTETIDNNSFIIVSAVYPISPAAKAGLKKYDTLLFANNISLTNLEPIYLDSILKSDNWFAESTEFKVLRGKDTTLYIQKEEVKVPTVFLDSLENIPLIKVTEFTRNTNNPNGTYYEFKNYLDSIKGTKTAIIDLRGNLGGSVWHCTAMAAELAPRDSILIYDIEHVYDNKRGNVIDTVYNYAREYLENREGAGLNVNWIILINRWSASCSERFVAAVKASRPETIIIGGENSYGKGIGQIYTKTYLGGLAYITFMQTFFPNGETFHGNGIEPDIKTSNTNDTTIYLAAIDATDNFLAKRSTAYIRLKTLPPKHAAREREPGMYKEALYNKLANNEF